MKVNLIGNELPKLSVNLIKELNENQVRYCHWKSNEHLVKGLKGKTDLDILVDRRHKDTFLKIMGKLKIKKLISPSHLIFSGVEDWLGFCSETGVLLHLHVHYELITGRKYVKEFTFPWTQYVLETVSRDEVSGMYITNPNVEKIILLLRIASKVKYKTLLKSFITKILPYSRDIQSEIDFLHKKTSEIGIQIALDNMFDDDSKLMTLLKELLFKQTLNVQEVFQLKKMIKSEMSYYKKYNFIEIVYRYFIGWWNTYFGKLMELLGFNIERKKKFESGGILIAFIGSDGAGKSTMIDRINKWLQWKINPKKFYFGSGDNTRSIILKIVQKFLKINALKTKNGKEENRKDLENTGKVKFRFLLKMLLKAKLFLYIAKEKNRNLRKASKLKLAGNVVIADRYPQIQFLGQNDSPYIRSRILKCYNHKYFEKLASKEESIYKDMLKYHPDVVIKLIVNPEVAIKRKPEHSYEQIKKKTSIVLSLNFQGSNQYEVDANKPIEEVDLKIKEIIWENL